VSPQRVDYWLLIPIQGRMQTSVRQREYISDTQRALLFSYPAMGPSRIVVDAGAVRMTVVMSEASLRRQLAALLGRPADAPLYPPLEFGPVVDLTEGYGRSIGRLAQLLLADAERGGSLVRNPLALASVEQFVINQLLLSHHHNYSAALHRTAPSAAPRDVKRAIDYIKANLAEPVRLTDVVAAAGVPGRTLFKHFEQFPGVSPMEYLRTARYEAVRQALGSTEVAGSISEVATAWGFTHLGRFATDYQKRFGERPSDTRRRSLSEDGHGHYGC
jgi:AraC-like DNA-binding protein